MKGRNAGRSLSDMPREGTVTRAVYDHLMANRGCAVELWQFGATQPQLGTILRSLRDYRGLDVRLVKKGRRPHSGTYVLAGEWVGKVYVDYIADRLKETAPGGAVVVTTSEGSERP